MIMTQIEFEEIWHSDADFVKCHTSGSTGSPKEITLSKEFLKESARRTIDFFKIGKDSRLHTCLDFIYIASKMMLIRADQAECELTSELPSNDPLRSLSPEETIDLLSIVPSQMTGLLDSGIFRPGIKRILIGGAPIPEGLRHRISVSGYEVWESYGMTETASHIALRRVTADATVPFRTLPGITVRKTAEDCLAIKLPNCEELITNDIADVLSETEFHILGRADDCVISGGVKIMPQMLEEMLGGFISYEYCISSVPDAKWGERLVIVVASGEAEYDEAFLRKAISVRLNQYRKKLSLGVKAPKDIVFVDSLPRTSNGKVNRNTLKEFLHKKNG